LDASSNPHISYYAASPSHELKYAHWTGSDWDIQIVDSTGDVGRYTSLALDAAEYPHISYTGDGDLRYAHWTENGWVTQTVDSEGGSYTSLALDATGNPHISYTGSDDLRYAHWTGSDWDIQIVDSEGYMGQYTSLALDDAGAPHISYHDYTNGDLKYARLLLPPLMLHKEATPEAGLRLSESLTYTLILSGPGVSVRLWDPLPGSVDYVTDSITGTIAPVAVYSPTAHAIVWQGALPTTTAQTIHFQVTPKDIIGTGSLSLSPPIVNTAWLTDMAYGRSMFATAIVNGWCVHLPLVIR
jgi:hypothetical protein